MGNLIYYEIRFGIIGFGSVNHTEISVSVISVFTRFGRPLPQSLKSIFFEIFSIGAADKESAESEEKFPLRWNKIHMQDIVNRLLLSI